MGELIMSQWTMWMFLVLGVVLCGAVAFLKNKNGDSVMPPMVSLGVFVVAVFTVYSLGLRYGTDLDDFCILNGHVQSGTYEEEWTEEYWETESYASGRDSKGNTTYSTRTVRKTRYHGPEWYAHTTVGRMNLDKAMYYGYLNRFKNEVKTGSSHGGQCSFGDGRTYATRWPGTMDTFIPISTSESVINWVKASQGTVLRAKGSDAYKVLPYPGLIDTPRGPKQPRVLSAGVPLRPDWVAMTEWDMDVLADAVGSSKQANPILYFANADAGYLETLKSVWIGGKKNDVIIVLGVKNFPQIDWVEVISWSKDAGFNTYAKDALSHINLDNRAEFTKAIETLIKRKFERNSMKNFKYLMADIQTPSWIMWTSGLFLVAAGLCGFFIQGPYTGRRGW